VQINKRQAGFGVLFYCSVGCFTLVTKQRSEGGNGFPSKEILLDL